MLDGRVSGSICHGKNLELLWSIIRTYLIIDKTPLLQERMHPHDCTNISRKISSTGRDGKVFGRVEAVGVDHEVAVVFVDDGGFASVSVIEELGQSLSFKRVDDVHVEPGAVAG